jgi:hypothetical protein
VLGKGPKYQAPGETVDRITADVVIFEDDGTETEISDAYFSQAGLLPPLKNALKPGNKPFVLGRVIKYPSKSSQKKGIETPEADQRSARRVAAQGRQGREASVLLVDRGVQRGRRAARASVPREARSVRRVRADLIGAGQR